MAATNQTQIIMEKILNGQFDSDDLETICTDLESEPKVSTFIAFMCSISRQKNKVQLLIYGNNECGVFKGGIQNKIVFGQKSIS